MRIKFHRQTRRRGAVAPLMAVLIIPLLGMVAFAVDLGYLIQVKADLQNIADAAALAGAQELMDPYARWITPSGSQASIRSAAITAAKEAAKKVALANTAGGTTITLLDSDIEVGYLDGAGEYNGTPPASIFPNSVRVVARRDSSANQEVALFFAPVIGTKTLPTTAGSRSTNYTGYINDFKSTGVRVLPMTYDVDHWDNFIKTGKDPDGDKSFDTNGDPTLLVYPSIKFSGNFGELSLDDEHAGSSEIRSWISNGISSTEVRALQSKGLIPLSSHPANTWDWLGNPGFKASVVQDVNTLVGKTFYLPLFKAKRSGQSDYQAGVGQGEDYNFNIVRFMPITITNPNRPNRDVIVKPSGYIDPGAEFDLTTIEPAGSTAGSTTTSFTTPKISQ